MRYVVDNCVSDYGVYETYYDKQRNAHKNLKLICNSLSNAKLIAEIMNTDLRNEKYEFKADKESEETETWNGIHAQITAPKGTFERIFNDADDDNDI